MDCDLEQMIDKEGIAYGGYLRLRVAKLTDDLAEIIVRQAGFEMGSDLFLAVREIVRAWRDRRYYYYKNEKNKPESFNQFLKDYNMHFFVSRLQFTIRSIDRLFRRAGDMAEDPRAAAEAKADWSRPPLVVDLLAGGPGPVQNAVEGDSQGVELRLEDRETAPPAPGTARTTVDRCRIGLGLSARGIVKDLLGRDRTGRTDAREPARP
jgi:hypothetical protein